VSTLPYPPQRGVCTRRSDDAQHGNPHSCCSLCWCYVLETSCTVRAALRWGRMVRVGEEGKQRHRSGNDNYAEEGNIGCDLFHSGEGLMDEVRAGPACETWGQESDDRSISKWEVEQRV
jgi:hypothetical protein